VEVCLVTKSVYEGTGTSVGPENLKVEGYSCLEKIVQHIVEV